MPRRKKNGQSPARVPGGPSEGGSLGHNAGYRLPQGSDGAMANNFPSSDSLSSSAKENIVKSMQEMFSHLDPDVIYIVLSECDFKVENAMDSLLELSVAAEVAAPIPSPVSGFERTAAALLSPGHFSEPRPVPDSSKPSQQPSSPPSASLLTEELDLLVDQELETLTTQKDDKEEHHSSQYYSAGASLSSFLPPPFPKQPLPELLQSSLKPRSRGPSAEQACPEGRLLEHMSGASSPLDQLSSWDDETSERQQSVVDFTHLLIETPADKPKPPLDLAASGRPSAFQVYKKKDSSHSLSEGAGVMPSDAIVGGARSKVSMLNREPLGYISSPWNLEAPVFSPRIHGNQGPTFITPVAQTPSNWPRQSRHTSPWMSHAPVSQAPLKPSATIPKSWALPAAPQFPGRYSRLHLEGKVLVLLRGAPGSGKSTKARALLEHNPGGVILSTDDYFTRHGEYQFDPTALGEAHEWNHNQAKEAFERGTNPIIIDNTNMQGWEMKPYVALKHGYKVLFQEPDTWWKNKPRELERRTTHNVPGETIRRMLNGYERFVTVQSIMGSHMPERKQRLILENRYSELDAQLQLNHSEVDQRIPDCIVESVMNEDHHGDEIPVAFCESIGQRVRRERPSRRSGFDRMEPADLVKDANQSESEAKEKEKTNEEEAGGRDEEEKGMPKMLDFEGDWPSEGSLQQRQVRRRERHKEANGKEDDGVSQEVNENKMTAQPGPDVTEFQKVLDLIQTGVGAIQTGSSCSSSLSLSSGEELPKEEETGGRFEESCGTLTFTQNCPGSSLNILDSPTTTAENIDSCQNSFNTDVEPSFNPNCNTSDNLKPNFDLFTESKSEAHLQPPSPPPSLVNICCVTQTEPQDFALLWRLSRQDSPGDTVVTGCSHFSDFTVLYGDSSRFVPELSSAVSAAVAVHPSGHKEVPYRVVHEKGTQVEEKELGETQDRLESLCILSRHFKLVSFDTLEDLYDKCNQDLEWTTNLLLDSGERFFKDEDGEEEREEEKAEDVAGVEDDQRTLGDVEETRLSPNVLDECHSEELPKEGPAGFEEGTRQSSPGTVSESNESSSNTEVPSFQGVAAPIRNKDRPDATSHSEVTSKTEQSLPTATQERDNTEHRVISEPDLEGGAWGGSLDDGVIIEESRTEIEDEIASMDEVHRLLQAELMELEREDKQRKEGMTERRHIEERRSRHLDIQSVELKLPTELALQLTELFGPVGLDPGTCSFDDYAVQMDLNLAKLLHQKWKETIQVSSLPTSVHQLADGYMSQDSQPEGRGRIPFMDHWSVSRPHVSLRDIIKEEQALQENVRTDLDRRDGATLLKEKQLFSLFPTIDRHFLQDIFRDHNYSLTQTELFLHSLLDEEPVKTVVAPEAPRSDHHRRQKPLESTIPNYQDVEDPEYDDFRAEASLQRSRQLESFAKAAEAYKQGRKDVASFYAQQGHMHGQRMREANHRAAVQIFERVNSSLLPQNILDLHGLHVDEALEHLAQVLQDKITECEQGLCRPQLSVITGRGNHSQGGVARIRPAVIDYLSNKHYRYTHTHTHTHTFAQCVHCHPPFLLSLDLSGSLSQSQVLCWSL
uniref:NEDD4 binding protein 2 n=1 Tax=Seriola dumerili TaxID=41447 RepID=A0A3B4VK84_SERDU